MKTARINTGIEIVNEIVWEKENENVREKEIEKGIGIADDRTAVIEVEDKESIEVVAETGHTEIEVKIVIVIKIVIEIGSIRYFLNISLTIDF